MALTWIQVGHFFKILLQVYSELICCKKFQLSVCILPLVLCISCTSHAPICHAEAPRSDDSSVRYELKFQLGRRFLAGWLSSRSHLKAGKCLLVFSELGTFFLHRKLFSLVEGCGNSGSYFSQKEDVFIKTDSAPCSVSRQLYSPHGLSCCLIESRPPPSELSLLSAVSIATSYPKGA